MNFIKTKQNEAVVIQGGINEDKCGVQCLSKGSQQFATENDFFFFTTSTSNKSFNVKTFGAIYLENQGNYLSIAKNGTNIYTSYFKLNSLGDFVTNVQGRTILELEKGVHCKLSGGDVKMEFMEKMRNFYCDLNSGNFLLTNVDAISLQSNKLSADFSNVNLQTNNCTIHFDELLLLKQDYGINIGDNLTISSENNIKILSTQGNIDFFSRNGEHINFENERPNGQFIFKGSSVNSQWCANVHKFNINTKKTYFNSTNSIEIQTSNFSTIAKSYAIEGDEFKVNSPFLQLGCLILDGQSRLDCETLDIVVKKFRLDCGRCELGGLAVEGREVKMDNLKIREGLYYERDGTIVEFADNVKIMSGGNIGILLNADRGGIKMSGDIRWNIMGERLLGINGRELTVGNVNYNLSFLSKELNLEGVIKCRSGEMLQIIDGDGVRFICGNSLMLSTPERIFISHGENVIEVDDIIKLENKNGRILLEEKVLLEGNINLCSANSKFLVEEIVQCKSNVIKLETENSLIEIQDGIQLENNSKINIGQNISIDSPKNIYLNCGYDLITRCNQLQNNAESIINTFGNFYQIVKGNFELIAGNNRIFTTDNVMKIEGDVNIGDKIILEDNKLEITCDVGKIDCNKMELLHMKLKEKEVNIGWENNFLNIGKEGIFLESENIGLATKNYNLEARKIILGTDRSKIEIGQNIIVESNCFGVVGKQSFIGWEKVGLDVNGERMLILGGNNSGLHITEKVSVWKGETIKLQTTHLSQYAKTLQIDSGNCKITADNLWLGKDANIFINKNIQLEANNLKYSNRDGTELVVGDSFYFKKENAKFTLDNNIFQLIATNPEYRVDFNVKGEYIVTSSKNVAIESTIGDIILRTSSSHIFLDGISKKMQVECPQINVNGSVEMNGKRMDIVSDILQLETKTAKISVDSLQLIGEDLQLKQMGKNELEIYSGGNVLLESENICRIKTKYGEISFDDGLLIESLENIKITCENHLGNLEIIGRHNGVIQLEKRLEIAAENMILTGEEKIDITTRGDMEIFVKDMLKLNGRTFIANLESVDFSISRFLQINANIVEITVQNYKLLQKNMGKIDIECDGEFNLTNHMVGHSENGLKMQSESNTHEKSIYLHSRVGGITLEGQLVQLSGKVKIGEINIIPQQNGLHIGGNMEVDALKVGNNMYISSQGISCMQKETVKWMNMDNEMEKLKCPIISVKILEGDINVNGNCKIQNGLEVKGQSGLLLENIKIGNWERENRSAIRLDMSNSIWNEGINIDADGKNAVNVKNGNMIIDGNITTKAIQIKENYSGKLREVEDVEWEKMLDKMQVEMGEDGELHANIGDMWKIMKQMMGIIKMQQKMLKKVI